MELQYNINYLAVFVCGTIAMGLSALWYSPRFLGKLWSEAFDKSEEEFEKNFNPIKAYAISYMAKLVMAFILAMFLSFVNATSPEEGMRLAFLAWVGFTATTITINYLFEGKTFKHFLVDGGYHLIVLLVYGAVLGAWR